MGRRLGLSRRSAISAAGGALITVSIAGCSEEMTPKDAQSRGADLQTLSRKEAATLAALGETLVPGAREAGMVPYVDAGLTAQVPDCLLMIRYLDVPGPFAPFYKAGLAALERFAWQDKNAAFSRLGAEDRTEIVRTISRAQPEGWSDNGAPPAPFFYFVLRGDAIDVTWGTMKGFEIFDQPYLAHIEPQTPW